MEKQTKPPTVRLKGARPAGPSRREVMASMTGLAFVATAPSGCGLTGDQIAALIDLIVQVAKIGFEIAEEVTGMLEFENDGDSTQYIEGVICLVNKAGSIVDEVTAYFEVPPGDSGIPFGNLFGDEAGEHLVEVLTAVGDWNSDTFQIG